MPSRFEIDDALWAEIEPLIPVRKRRRRPPGRKAIPDRLVLNRGGEGRRSIHSRKERRLESY